MSQPSYQQLDMMDCGAACLQSISKYYGKYFLFRTQVNNIILTLFLF